MQGQSPEETGGPAVGGIEDFRRAITQQMMCNNEPHNGEAMALKINEDCIICGACEPECPNAAITEGDEIYIIDPRLCNECEGQFEEPQCAGVCPVDACVPDPDHPS